MSSPERIDHRLSAITVVDQVIEAAIRQGASDIHFEPAEEGLRIRMRIDGHLQVVNTISEAQRSAVLARIKVLSNLDIAEKRRPQDGRFRFQYKASESDIRVSFAPVITGEKAVLRILDTVTVIPDFTSLGFFPEQEATIRHILSASNGLILVTGPTGCGKSTTLYTALHTLNEPLRNIMTIEDPVERQIAGINQSAVNEAIGFTFANALRSFLRQDPNVIMVGEIRDKETADIAMRASLTGHLVLSTLHTNDARSALVRLQDIGIEPFLIGATIRMVIAQRLVRTLCKQCKTPVSANSSLLESQFEPFSDRLPEKSGWTLYEPTGCIECRFTGYKGRSVIGEVLELNPVAVERILKDSAGSTNDQLLLNGARKVIQGETTFREVLTEAG